MYEWTEESALEQVLRGFWVTARTQDAEAWLRRRIKEDPEAAQRIALRLLDER